MGPEHEVEDTVIEGVLVPVRWSAGGEVSQVGLMTFDEAEYRVDMVVAEAHNLRSYLQEHIRIVGRTKGNRVVHVTAVELCETHAMGPGSSPESASIGTPGSHEPPIR